MNGKTRKKGLLRTNFLLRKESLLSTNLSPHPNLSPWRGQGALEMKSILESWVRGSGAKFRFGEISPREHCHRIKVRREGRLTLPQSGDACERISYACGLA